MAYNTEFAYLGSIGYMGSDAGAGIVIPYPHDPEGFRNVVRKLGKIDQGTRLFTAKKFYRYG